VERININESRNRRTITGRVKKTKKKRKMRKISYRIHERARAIPAAVDRIFTGSLRQYAFNKPEIILL